MMKKSQIDYRVLIAGIIALAVIECVALFNGINGTVLTIVVGIIAMAIGVAVPKETIIK